MNRRGQNLAGPLGGSGMVGRWGASSLIENIQYGTVALSGVTNATTTITSVDITRATVIHLGQSNNWSGGSGAQYSSAYVELTNATTVKAVRNTVGGIDCNVNFAVIQFCPGILRSVQTGSVTINSGLTNTATVTTVNTDKSLLIYLGLQSNAAVDGAGYERLSLTNATTITGTRQDTTGGGIPTVTFALLEFF